MFLTTGLTVGLVASGMASASAAPAPTPRISANQCAFNAPQNGYTITDTAANNKCTINKNGTFLWSSKAFAKWKRAQRKSERVKFKASFKVIPRGDVRPVVVFRFIRGNKVIKKRVRVNSAQRAGTSIRFPRRGTWAVVVRYKNKVVTTTVRVRNA